MPRPRTRTFGGCLTCRTRKVKCGRERPTCANCNRLEIVCRGYKAQLHWHLVNPALGSEYENIDLEESETPHNISNARKDKMRGSLFTGKQG
jgi:hypothetical protein